MNETIDEILEEMADMKEYISRKEGKIAILIESISGVNSTVERNSAQILSV